MIYLFYQFEDRSAYLDGMGLYDSIVLIGAVVALGYVYEKLFGTEGKKSEYEGMNKVLKIALFIILIFVFSHIVGYMTD